MRFYQRQSTMKELKALVKFAKKTCNNEMKGALNDACDKAVDAAKAVAPVYDPAKWEGFWWAYEHHYTPPGTLARSIKHTKAVCHARGESYTIQFRADASFAAEMEEGFRHHLAHKTIPGHYFMRSSYNQVFIPTWHLKMREATYRMFMTKTVTGV